MRGLLQLIDEPADALRRVAVRLGADDLIANDALAIEGETERRAAMNLARRAESAASVRGALTLASTETAVVVAPDDLDCRRFESSSMLTRRNATDESSLYC